MGLGFASGPFGLYHGSAINEGATDNLMHSVNNYYFQEREITNILAVILGNKEVYEAYTNSSLISLKKLMYPYISPKSVNKLIYSMDLNLFQFYFEEFLANNKNPFYNKEFKKKMLEYYLNRTRSICQIIEELFEAKYRVKMEDSKLGRLILQTKTFQRTITDFPNRVCKIEIYDDNTVQVFFSDLYGSLLQIRDTEEHRDYYESREFREEMAKKIGGEYLNGDIDIYLKPNIRQENSNIIVSVDDVSVLLDLDKLPNLDVDQVWKNLQKIQNESDLQQQQTDQEER